MALSSKASSQPEDVQVHLVALGQLFVSEGLEAFALLPIVALLRVVPSREVIEVTALEGVFFEREMQVSAQVLDPELFGPWLFLHHA